MSTFQINNRITVLLAKLLGLPLPIFPLPTLPTPPKMVAQFSVAHFTVAQFTVYLSTFVDCWRCAGRESAVCSAATWHQKPRHRHRRTRRLHTDRRQVQGSAARYVTSSLYLPRKRFQFIVHLQLYKPLNCPIMPSSLLLLVCVSFTIIGQPRNSVLIRRV